MSKSQERLVVHVPRRLTHQAWGGTERVLEQTLPVLRKHGYQSTIFTSQALDATRVGEMDAVPITRFPYFYPEWPMVAERKLRLDNKGGNTVSWPLAQALSEIEDLALVHCHTGNILGAQCLRVARSRGVPMVITLHGGHFAIPVEERRNLANKGEGTSRRGLPWGRILSLMLDARNLLQNVDAVICVGVEEYEAAKLALPSQQLLFLPGGVNFEEFALADRVRGRQLLQVDPVRPLVACIARVDRQKDQATLVRAWSQHCKYDCDLALIGPETSPGYAAELRNLARGAKGRMILPGGLDPKEMPHLYAAADVSVLPSRHEPFGLSCLESWAAGTVLVGSNVGGPRWLLNSEKEGRLFPVGDAKTLGSLLAELLGSPEQRQRLVKAGLKRVQNEFSWKVRAQKLSDLYRDLMLKRS